MIKVSEVDLFKMFICFTMHDRMFSGLLYNSFRSGSSILWGGSLSALLFLFLLLLGWPFYILVKIEILTVIFDELAVHIFENTLITSLI